MESPIRIVVIGGSAGSLGPLKTIVSGFPSDLGAAVFVVQHVARNTPSRLPEILGLNSPLPVAHAVDGAVVAPGNVYVAPSDHHLVVERGRMRLQSSPRDPWSRPSINSLFRSAVAAYGSSVAGVLLSGALSDGVAGLWEIKQVGGMTIVQAPREALRPEMPETAVREVDVDHVVPSRDIAALLARYAVPQSAWATSERRPRLLIVEDEAAQAIDLEDQLRSLGYDVVASVATGEEALLAAHQLPDVALVDVKLGGLMDGTETAELLSRKFKVGVIYTTSHDDDETLRRVKRTFPHGYLCKPLRTRDLRGAIEVALAARGFMANG